MLFDVRQGTSVTCVTVLGYSVTLRDASLAHNTCNVTLTCYVTRVDGSSGYLSQISCTVAIPFIDLNSFLCRQIRRNKTQCVGLKIKLKKLGDERVKYWQHLIGIFFFYKSLITFIGYVSRLLLSSFSCLCTHHATCHTRSRSALQQAFQYIPPRLRGILSLIQF
jgi:hypothetical protein